MFLFGKKKTSVFPDPLEFTHPWRPYQDRVLQELKEHLDDAKLHVVAAPGAGKTVLGLEVISRLNAPTLILSPTLTIRDQWLDRLEHLFLPDNPSRPAWISTDILDPGAITSITYQALHMAVTGRDEGDEEGEEEEEGPGRSSKAEKADVPALLERAGVRTVVLDECHHLRAEWWRSLAAMVEKLDTPTLVALTATPPYDVPPQEWARYQELCGPVDTEISVPELVAEENLCPHQDYVFLSAPASQEQERIKAFRTETDTFLGGLMEDGTFIGAVADHPCLQQPEEHVKEILDKVRFFSSTAVFLHHATGRAPKKLLKVMGLHREPIPPMSSQWWEELLQGCLYTERPGFKEHHEHFKGIERDLNRMGAVERRQVRLGATREIEALLAKSLSKLESIKSIVALEHQAMGEGLRQVILTDYIRVADLPRKAGDEQPIHRIGVVPIFELLRREGPGEIKLGVLSGSLVVVPEAALPVLRESCRRLELDPDRLTARPLSHDERFVRISLPGQDRKRLVGLVTDAFSRGAVTVLVGTKSLLGEGWDAPSVNSLVLATFVGSFMLSNQMRGRAIRVQPGNPAKTANIWHPVCVVDEKGPDGRPCPGPDWDTITRRFKAFVGPSQREAMIENGLARMSLGDPPFTERSINEINEWTVDLALDREGLRRRWEEALGIGSLRMVQELESPAERLPRRFIFVDAILALILEGVSMAGFILSMMRFHGSGEEGLTLELLAFAAVFGIAALFAMPYFLKAAFLVLRHGTVSGSLGQVGKALLRALVHTKAIRTKVNKMRIRTYKGSFETAVIRLEGASTFERSLFLDAMEELLAPIENPRYLLVRKSRLGPFRRRDFHAVPAVLGRKKELAEFFAMMWKRYVGPCALVYTRNEEGRKTLLEARGRSLSAVFLRRSERKNRWR